MTPPIVRTYAQEYLHRPSNPSYTVEELVYQLQMTKAKVIIASSAVMETAFAAARIIGLSADRIVLLTAEKSTTNPTLDALVTEGLAQKPHFTERTLTPGEAKTKLALLSFSSGTTGKPKVWASFLVVEWQFERRVTGCCYFTLCRDRERYPNVRTSRRSFPTWGHCHCWYVPSQFDVLVLTHIDI